MGMERIYWSGKFSVGNDDIDNDHKKLISIINDLIDMVELGNDREKFASILSDLTDYFMQHFKKEENYMLEMNYPYLKQHKQIHNEFKYKVAMYNTDLLGATPPDPHEIILYLKKWWADHILHVDANYEKFRKKNNVDASY